MQVGDIASRDVNLGSLWEGVILRVRVSPPCPDPAKWQAERIMPSHHFRLLMIAVVIGGGENVKNNLLGSG